jgi:inhibitor of KinA sporulation pathway (predicted exonuclease)
MNIVIVDLEATCWSGGSQPRAMEIIEIGACFLCTPDLEVRKEFSSFVKPVKEPVLSDFCMSLTSITQEDVDSARKFPEVLRDFLDWIGTEQYFLCSWGAYDLNQLKVDCERHSILFPENFKRHINLKQTFAEQHKKKQCGMKKALRILGLELDGTHHRGLDDARNISKIAKFILPKIMHAN